MSDSRREALTLANKDKVIENIYAIVSNKRNYNGVFTSTTTCKLNKATTTY